MADPGRSPGSLVIDGVPPDPPLIAGQTLPPGPPSLAAIINIAKTNISFQDAKQMAVDAFEKEYLLRLFAESNFNLSEAARRSGVHRRYLRELYKKHTIDLVMLRASRTR